MNKEIERVFSIDDIQFVEEPMGIDTDFAVAKLWFLAEGDNSHKAFIPHEVLKRDAGSVLGKPVVAAYNSPVKSYATDVGTHEGDKMEIVGYCPPNAQVGFKEKDGKIFAIVDAVISKLYATKFYQIFKSDNKRAVSVEITCKEHDNEDGSGTIMDSFRIHAITALGKNYKPSVSGADMSIVKFSEVDAENFYNKNNKSALQKFSDDRKKLHQDLIEKKLGLETEEKQMKEEKKEFESEVEMSEAVEETAVEVVEETVVEFGCHSAELADEPEKEDDAEEEKEEEEKEELAEVEKEETTEEEMAKEEVDEEDKTEEFSYNVNADLGALNAYLERETANNEALTMEVQEMWNAADMNIIMEKYVAVSKELAELQEFKTQTLNQELSNNVAKVLSIVKNKVTDEEYMELQTEGMSYTFENLSVFENKIKALAFDKGETKSTNVSKHITMRDYSAGDIFGGTAPKTDVNSIYKNNLK